MDYSDPIYGQQNIAESVLIELMTSKAMGRLQGVLQHGISGLIGITSPVTRFDHSLGVLILVRLMGGSLKEQIAALLHDISHTAFSHVIDYVFNNHNGQSYHDEHQYSYLIKTEIPQILAKHGYDWTDFLEEKNFPILEQPAPRLCADRLDYFLRDSLDLGLSTIRDVQNVLDHLVVADGRIATDSIEIATWLGNNFMAADERSWANFDEVGLYEVTAKAIRQGLAVGLIDEDDIWGTDQPLWQKLLAAADPRVQSWVKLVNVDTRFVWDEENPTFRISTKIRTIDPDVLITGELRPLSALDPAFAADRDAYIKRKSGSWPMRVISPESTARVNS